MLTESKVLCGFWALNTEVLSAVDSELILMVEKKRKVRTARKKIEEKGGGRTEKKKIGV